MLESGLDELSCNMKCPWASTCGILVWPEILRSRKIGEHAGLTQVRVVLESVNVKLRNIKLLSIVYS
jgi:hypothetical protein